MTRLHVHAVSAATTDAAVSLLDAELAAHRFQPQLVFAFYGCEHDDRLLHEYLCARFPQAALVGGSSAGGFMTHRGTLGPQAIGLMLVHDDDGDYGAAAAPLGADAAHTAETLLLQALAGCGCSGELPELIWVYQAPGREEAVIEGLRRVVGDRCPIVGGSSADNDVSGRWRQIGRSGPMSDGLALAVLLPSAPLGHAFRGGYEPAGPSGVVTQSSGREILRIDGQPAAEVYNRWIGGRLDTPLAQADGSTILLDTTLCPIATDTSPVEGVSHFLLIHPESVTSGHALRTFRNVEAGTRLYAMKGDRQRLVDRAGRVAGQALGALPAGHASAAGALVVYCGGCKLAVGEDIAGVSQAVVRSLGDVPFIGCFTFGEQGQLMARNQHGNLMVSAVVFSRA
jgi:hypothetical protein